MYPCSGSMWNSTEAAGFRIKDTLLVTQGPTEMLALLLSQPLQKAHVHTYTVFFVVVRGAAILGACSYGG